MALQKSCSCLNYESPGLRRDVERNGDCSVGGDVQPTLSQEPVIIFVVTTLSCDLHFPQDK